MSDFVTIINLSIYKLYFLACYFIAISFSAICFNLMLNFYKKDQIAQVLASAFMTSVFYISAEASDILEELFTDKIQEFKTSLKDQKI